MQIDYTGKTVVITGSAGAIGSSLAEAFAKNGANVAICARNLEKAEILAEKIIKEGGKAGCFYLDVTKRENITAVADLIADTYSGIDILINNAGVNVSTEDRKPVHEFSDEKWDWIVDVDMNGVFNCTKAFVPYIKKKGGGNVLNISSVVGIIPFRNQCAFTAAKAAVINFSKACAIELAQYNIRVNVIAPGSIMFEGTKALFYSDKEKAEKMLVNIPMHRAGEGKDIANAALYLASDEDAAYVTGSVLTVDGGWTCGFARDF